MDNALLIFFALPIATIIISIVLQKIIKCPIWVALLVFAIYLIVAFTAFDATFLVAAIVYSILAFIAAFLTMLYMRWNNHENRKCMWM